MLFYALLGAASAADDNSKAPNYSFITIGDWGAAAIESKDWYKDTVYAVAKQMADSASAIDANFIVNTGDNFYWCGIQNTSDFQIAVDYTKPYLQYDSLRVPWYNALGNHEYGYNVQAQIDLTELITNWNLPDRYYTKRVKLSSNGDWLTLVFIDSNPCVQEYRDDNESGWDPCGDRFPTCSIHNGKDNFEGPCKFHENILAQSCKEQYNTFKKMLEAVDDDDWLIIVGHHPADEMDVEDMLGVMQDKGFDLYLNGHTHTLNHYSIDDDPIYITSGAGGMVETDSQTSEATPAKQRTKLKSYGEPELLYNHHSYKTIYNKKVAGYVTNTFNADFTELTNNFMTYEGDVIHSFKVKKGDRHIRALKRKLKVSGHVGEVE